MKSNRPRSPKNNERRHVSQEAVFGAAALAVVASLMGPAQAVGRAIESGVHEAQEFNNDLAKANQQQQFEEQAKEAIAKQTTLCDVPAIQGQGIQAVLDNVEALTGQPVKQFTTVDSNGNSTASDANHAVQTQNFNISDSIRTELSPVACNDLGKVATANIVEIGK